ncbi:MAG: hypothetical protein ACE5ID_09340 [Acidobacteriota bacterium]
MLILLSDGCDNSSRPTRRFGSLLGLAARIPHLIIFSIGLDLPQTCRKMTHLGAVTPAPATYLSMVSRQTGGEYFGIKRINQLDRVLRLIHRRLEEEGTVTYVAGRPDEGIVGFLDGETGRRPRVKVRGRTRSGCRILSAGPPRRLAGPAARLPLPDGRSETPVIPPLPAGGPSRPVPGPYLAPGTERIQGRLMDLVLDRGPLFVPPAPAPDSASVEPREEGKLAVSIDRLPEMALREVEILVLPFARMKRELHSMADVLLWMIRHRSALGRPASPPQDEGGRHLPLLLLIHGETFLEERVSLGQALFAYPGYREWARSRSRADRSAAVESMLKPFVEEGEGPRPEIEAARRYLLSRPLESAAARQYLAEWLGDQRAIDLTRSLEKRAANLFLEKTALSDPTAPEVLQEIVAGWPFILEWLAPVNGIRVLTPLIPSYDLERDVVGFHRVLLPYPRMESAYDQFVPGEPRGLAEVRWMLAAAASGPGDVSGYGVEEVKYKAISSRQRRLLADRIARLKVDPLGPGGHRRIYRHVSVRFSRAGEGGPFAFSLETFYLGGIVLCRSAVVSNPVVPGTSLLPALLNRTIDQQGRVCPDWSLSP